MSGNAAEMIDASGLLSDTLRESTSRLHRATEALPAMAVLLDPGLDIDTYRRTQARFYGVFSPLETTLQDPLLWSTLGLDPPASAVRLARDLEALGVEPESLPMQVLMPLPNIHAALGRAYVLEGSALGARFIDNQLGRHGWYERSRHGHYFVNPATMQRWQQFRKVINAMPVDERERASIIGSAQDTFVQIHDWMRN